MQNTMVIDSIMSKVKEGLGTIGGDYWYYFNYIGVSTETKKKHIFSLKKSYEISLIGEVHVSTRRDRWFGFQDIVPKNLKIVLDKEVSLNKKPMMLYLRDCLKNGLIITVSKKKEILDNLVQETLEMTVYNEALRLKEKINNDKLFESFLRSN